MTRTYILILLLFAFNLSFSQKRYNVFSVELSYGMNIPILPLSTINQSNYNFPRHLDLGLRYNFNEFYGIKLYVARDRFQNKNDKNIGNTYKRIGIEGIYNFTNHLNLNDNINFNILLHAGVGLTHAFPDAIKRYRNGGEFTFGLTPENTKDYERIGNMTFGVTPQYKYSDRIAFRLDLAFIFSREQQYFYNGELINIDRRKVTGRFANFTIGIQYYIGNKRSHADWYY